LASCWTQRDPEDPTLMQPFTIGGGSTPLKRVLVIGCDSDDIEIGCGATMLSLTRSLPDLAVTWVVLGAEGRRAEEARLSAETFTAAAASREIVIHGFRDGFMPFSGEAVKEAFEALRPRSRTQTIEERRNPVAAARRGVVTAPSRFLHLFRVGAYA
jgi:hypothetical protein